MTLLIGWMDGYESYDAYVSGSAIVKNEVSGHFDHGG